jgi:TonB family protein
MAAEFVTTRELYARSLLRLASMMLKQTHTVNIHAIGIFDANILERRVMSLMTKQRETKGLLRVGFAAVCVLVGLATCGSALALRLEVNEPPPPATATANTRVVRVAGGIVAGSKLGGENPTYPADARKAKVEGTVVLKAVISKTGEISSLQVTSGPEALRQSAVKAVRTWHYKPYLLNGEPTAVETTIRVTYNLQG